MPTASKIHVKTKPTIPWFSSQYGPFTREERVPEVGIPEGMFVMRSIRLKKMG